MSDHTQPIGLKVRLPFASQEELLQGYGQHLSKGGIYLRAKSLHAPGTAVTLEIKLSSGARVLFATAVVAYVTGARGHGVPGMGFKFIALDGPSRRFLDTAAATMPHARSNDPPVPKAVGSPDYSPAAVPSPPPPEPSPLPPPTPPSANAGPPPSQAQPKLPSELAGRMSVQAALPAEVEAPPFEASPQPAEGGPVVGIDLGTSNTCVAIVRNGHARVIRGPEGSAQIPSVVALSATGKLVVGGPAKALLNKAPTLAVSGFKRLLGRQFDAPEVGEMTRRSAWEAVATEVGRCGVRLGTRVYSLEEISSLVLREAKELAEAELGVPVNRAVITVPAWYTETQRQSVREAGHLAGLHVERIVNEPTAAALAYGYGKGLSQRVLVYDLGGGTFDASVVELHDNVYEVVSTGGDNFLGGLDFDHAIVAWLMAEFEGKYDTFFTDRVSVQRVTEAAERAKIALSQSTEERIHVPFVGVVDGRPVDLDVPLTRSKLVYLTRGLVEKTMETCQSVLSARQIRVDDIDEILLVGGQSRAPLVQDRITVLFGKKPVTGVNPEEAVARGAALLAHALESREGLLLIDVLPMSIGVGLPGGRFHPVIARNTSLPATRRHRITTTRDDQRELELPIFQGENPLARSNTYLGTFRMADLPPGPRGTVAVNLSFELNNECLLTVTAREEAGGSEVSSVFVTQDTPEQVRERLRLLEESGPPQPGVRSWFRRMLG